MLRTVQGKPMRGCSCRNMMGKTTLPTLEPMAAQPIAMGRFVVKLLEMTTIAGM